MVLRQTLACALLLFVAATSSSAHVVQSTASADAATIVDASGLMFESRIAFCRFHCRATHAKRAYRHLRADSECTVALCGADASAASTSTTRARRLHEVVDGEAGVVDRSSSSSSSTSTQAPSYTFASSDLRDSDASNAGNALAHAATDSDDSDNDDGKHVQLIDIVTCRNVTDVASANGAKVALAIGDAQTHAFAGFYDAFFQAYDAMVASVDATFDACQLQFLQQGFLANRTQSDKATRSSPAATAQRNASRLQPMLVKLRPRTNSSSTNSSTHSSGSSSSPTTSDDSELACVFAIKRVYGASADTFTPFLIRSDQSDAAATIMLVHVNATVANRIVDLECVASVTALPAILKLTPFAKSAYAYALDRTTATEGPALEIRLVKGVDAPAALERLAAAIQTATGIANALTAQTTGSRVLTLAALEEFATWAIVVAIVVDDDAVEWVDRKQTITTGALAPLASIEQQILATNVANVANGNLMPQTALRRTQQQQQHHHERRLDNYVQDLVGVHAMQQHNITGAGIVVGVTDTGLYLDHDQFDQASRTIFDRIDATARKVVLYRAFANRVDESEHVVCGHGTHVAGILAGKSQSRQAPNLGIAYDAQIAFMDIGKQAAACAGQRNCDVTLETPGDVSELMGLQVDAGARIFSFSWGTGGNDYNTQSRDLDEFVYSHPDVLLIVAAGNSGDKGAHSISSPSGAKNVLSIGASLNAAATFSATPCASVLNPLTVASFSSIGPTLDGRQKPDLVAPGMAIDSAQSEAPGTTVKTNAICSLQGTSQATPVVAGMAVLLFEWLRDGWWHHGVKDPSFGMPTVPAALLKALLIHTGEKLARRLVAPKTGVTSCVAMETQAIALTTYPDAHQGYGKPTLRNIANFAQSSNLGPNASAVGADVYFYPNSSAPNAEPRVVEGAEATFSFTLEPHADLRVTLVWTDPAGSLGGRVALQNDLDLTVRVPHTDAIFYPLSGNGTRDAVNNVEMVDVTYDQIVAAMQSAGLVVDKAGGSVTVEAVVYGYSVKAGRAKTGQAFALVASSTSSAITAQLQTTAVNAFWQPWMTIGAVVAGALAMLVVMALLWRIRVARAALSAKKRVPPLSQSRPVNTQRAHAHYRADGVGSGAVQGERRPGAGVASGRPVQMARVRE